ncbi:hypothetical protein H074_03320 [Amycolatopsis decaplanina DSM 44594]|uniref:Uncharacterized protein n=1 Tax=Amycolatopsis decaplanina DSM 44594 TaxID=1284240 RepID=M2ZVI3_9PSEU|nr:hypothetical protein H074_03320 [Amycolatopsis decaplanina DSM 44594]
MVRRSVLVDVTRAPLVRNVVGTIGSFAEQPMLTSGVVGVFAFIRPTWCLFALAIFPGRVWQPVACRPVHLLDYAYEVGRGHESTF